MNLPKLRFKADDGSEFPEWEERRIDSFSNCYAGATPSTKVAEYWNNGSIPWMSSGEVNNREIYETEKKISELGYEKSSTKMIKPNTVVIALAGQGKTRGMVAITRISVCTNQSLCAIETNDMVDDDYLYQYLIPQYDNLRRISSGDGTRGGLNLQLVGEYKVFLPVLSEQKKIASFLSTIDGIIQSTESELTAWQERKKGVMQKIFNREVRFKADDGSEFPEWEEKRLGEVGQFYTGVGFSDRFQGYKELPIDVYKVSDMNINGNEKYMKIANNTVDDNILRDMKTKSVNDSCLVFAKVGAAIYGERKRITLKPFVIDNNMMAFMPDVQLLQMEYLYTWSCSVRFSKYAQVGALPSYNSSDIGCIKIPIPSLPEQRKIAECLSSLDDAINQIQAELSSWKEFKKGLLQQMFVYCIST